MKAPIIIFAYNRAEHLKRTLEALARNEGAAESELHIYVDAPKEGADASGNIAVKKYLNEVQEQQLHSPWFASLTVTNAAAHKGLANSVIGGVTEVIGKAGRVIVVEDDIVTSPYFLRYMNDALDYYAKNAAVWSISGYTLPLRALNHYQKDVYAFYRCCSWGWATWKDRWDKNDWQIKDFQRFDRNFFRRRKFNRGGRDLSFQLDRQMLGRIDSWAIRWGYNESKQNCVTIYPRASYVDNEGCDGSGTHFASASSNYSTQIQGAAQYTFCEPIIDRSIAKEFRARYSEKWLKAMVKEVLYCLHLYRIK